MIDTWTKIKDENIFKRALKFARGVYQRNLLAGIENLSGSTLRGKAKSYGGRYKISRQNLLSRLTRNKITWSEEKEKNNKRILVLG